EVTFAILLTLVMRPVGAFLFGHAADRWGRRPTLMVDVLLYSFIEFASVFSPSLTVLLVLRALYGVAMGGEWGVGASLTMESIPPHARGFVSGLLQSGYPTGYFLASIVYGLLFPTFLQVQHALSPHAVGTIAAIYNVGAILGGILCGSLSERIGRRRMIVIAALLSLPVLPLWAFAASPVLLAMGAFLMQVMVQ